MKLKFTIDYATQWGESLHIALRLHSTDGKDRTVDLTMSTSDGKLWEVETAAVASRQHPVTEIEYYYYVGDEKGQTIRREWRMVSRRYAFDSTKSYVFNDQWREQPLNSFLYTNAYLTTQHLPPYENVKAAVVPLFRKTIIFRVSAPQLVKGQALALIGNHPALGNWSEARYLQMEYIGQADWLLSINIDSILMPLEYKYVVIDQKTHSLIAWEEGDNRTVDNEVADGHVLVCYGQNLRLREQPWRAAGVVVPLFALRSEHSCGVGDFGDLRRLIDWVRKIGMKVIQLLPVNDTTTDGHWHDCHPYNITSSFALHPHYLDLEQLGLPVDKNRRTVYKRQQRELNALGNYNYEAVHRVKMEYAELLFEECGKELLASEEFLQWFDKEREWLEPYAHFLSNHADSHVNPQFVYYIQYNLHKQLKGATDYARSHGVAIVGDLPIGVNRDSVATTFYPALFNLDCQAGAMPDTHFPQGQNWGFPTYCWERKEGSGTGDLRFGSSMPDINLKSWLRWRFRWMENYFDAVRIDHVLGFFRMWEIPGDSVYGLLGHFSPALPLTAEEIEYFGLPLHHELLTRPFVNDRVLERLFGLHAQYVRDNFLNREAYGLYAIKPEFDTQRKVQQYFCQKNDENSLWIKNGMYRLISNVLFVEDKTQHGLFHPRIYAYREPVFDALNSEEKDAYMRLYNNYFYQRHSVYWGNVAMRRLSDVLEGSRMLICAEDLGTLPDCVAPVLDALRILTLEVQSLPKLNGVEFNYLDGNPYRSVATISTHDMAPLRLWWEQSMERTQRYYVTMLQKEGRAPEHLPAHIAEEIIARHLYCPSMLCMLSLQDWLSMDSELRSKSVRDERVNVPGDAYNRWQWRMHLTLEQLLSAERFNNKVRTMIQRSRR